MTPFQKTILGTGYGDESRKRSRLPLHLPVMLREPDSFDIPPWTETVEIGDDGFSCTTSQPFRLGDQLQCLIAMPTQGSAAAGEQLYLSGLVEVVRLVVNQEEGFSIVCRFADYHMISGDSVRSWLPARGASAS